ncbi:MAG TPA: 30S ribosomal protein S20 [Anaerolineales bacterium]|nr:30S ribosomal protein S20 [Anaerolineales bacterium]
MANTRSAKKRMRQNPKRRLHNRAVQSRARSHLRLARKAIGGTETGAGDAVRKAISELDRAASKGVIHKNNAARRKSRLMKKLAGTKAKA